MTVAVAFILLFVFLVLGVPIAFSLALSGSIGLLMFGGINTLLGILETTPHSSIASFLLTTIPMFILMAEFMTVSGITEDMFYAANKWFGHWPGGLGIATIFAGAGLGAVSGSSTASASTLATAAYPEMKKYGYKTSFSMGTISMSGTLAILIPPSIILILYGIMTETPIGSLLIAGIIPGVLTALGFILTILLIVKLKPGTAPDVPAVPFRERLYSLRKIWSMLILVIVVIGSIYSGIVTATEAGALGAFVAFLISLFMKRLTVKNVLEALERTLKTTTMILTIIIGAMIFGYFLTMTQVTQQLVSYISGLEISKWWILVFLIIIYLLLGMFMDQVAILVLTLPLIFPIIAALGFNPIWFGIIVTKTVEIGLVTPPIGMNVFVASGAAGVKTTEAFRGIAPFVVVDMLVLLLLIIFPVLSTWLPDMMIQ